MGWETRLRLSSKINWSNIALSQQKGESSRLITRLLELKLRKYFSSRDATVKNRRRDNSLEKSRLTVRVSTTVLYSLLAFN